jgi:hypothetical protein
MNRRFAARLVAAAAAYVMALNALMPALSGMLPPAGSAANEAAIICSGSGATLPPDPGAPIKPTCPCDAACMMPACAGAGVRPQDLTLAYAGPASSTLAGFTQESPLPPAFRLGSGNLARGPPSA